MTAYLMKTRENTNEKDQEDRAQGKGNPSIGADQEDRAQGKGNPSSGAASSCLVFPTSFTLCSSKLDTL